MAKKAKSDTQVRRNRGRQQGWTAHPKDGNLLLQAARFINARYAGSPTEAFRELIGEDATKLRRLQRKWTVYGDELLAHDRRVWRERCDIELNALMESIPTLYARVVSFSNSSYGKKLLTSQTDLSGEPLHPMALGIVKLMELVDEGESISAQKHGRPSQRESKEDHRLSNDNSLQVKRRFQSAIDGWVSGEGQLTTTSLRELAKRCLELADKVEQEQIAADKVSVSTSFPPPTDDKPSQAEGRANNLKPGTKSSQEAS